jgi:hypothetical protein
MKENMRDLFEKVARRLDNHVFKVVESVVFPELNCYLNASGAESDMANALFHRTENADLILEMYDADNYLARKFFAAIDKHGHLHLKAVLLLKNGDVLTENITYNGNFSVEWERDYITE